MLVSGLLILAFTWQRVRKDATIADLTLAAISQPREEVVVSGYLKNFGAAPFSLEYSMNSWPSGFPTHCEKLCALTALTLRCVCTKTPSPWRSSVRMLVVRR